MIPLQNVPLGQKTANLVQINTKINVMLKHFEGFSSLLKTFSNIARNVRLEQGIFDAKNAQPVWRYYARRLTFELTRAIEGPWTFYLDDYLMQELIQPDSTWKIANVGWLKDQEKQTFATLQVYIPDDQVFPSDLTMDPWGGTRNEINNYERGIPIGLQASGRFPRGLVAGQYGFEVRYQSNIDQNDAADNFYLPVDALDFDKNYYGDKDLIIPEHRSMFGFFLVPTFAGYQHPTFTAAAMKPLKPSRQNLIHRFRRSMEKLRGSRTPRPEVQPTAPPLYPSLVNVAQPGGSAAVQTTPAAMKYY